MMKQLQFFHNFQLQYEYEKVHLDENNYLEVFRQILLFQLNEQDFDSLWNEHPQEFHNIVIHGKKIKTPRWQQAYGKNYEYTGSRNNALPLNKVHQKYIDWCQKNIDKRLNGLLINWYEGRQQHYIGKHRDSIKGLMVGSPIVTISHGEERIFRMRPYKGNGFQDFEVQHGDVLVIPWETNQNYTHEVPSFKKYQNKRISVTLRAYT
ncbi:MAG: alpha-ketoglutarate-dependent dioxygenase AlkB [Bacteroidota bacterium]